ncbi:MAG TPA: hypothetical protein VLD19_07905, partial [Chitinophagaceae bacterium]|nr:hypothetical protein [Chitinophagaceae bacterium]
MKKLVFLSCALCFLQFAAHATITLPSLFSDNMVFQQKTDAAIWGSTTQSRPVMIVTSWNNKKYSALPDIYGRRKIKFSTP